MTWAVSVPCCNEDPINLAPCFFPCRRLITDESENNNRLICKVTKAELPAAPCHSFFPYSPVKSAQFLALGLMDLGSSAGQ
jgi:hypothetical protein